MTHTKKHALLYALLMGLSWGRAYGALVNTSSYAIGCVQSTYEAVAKAAVEEALGKSGSSGGSGSTSYGSDSLQTNLSVSELLQSNPEIFSISESSSLAGSVDSGSVRSEVSKQVELREATETVLNAWRANSNVINYALKSINSSKLQQALKPLLLQPSSWQPVEKPSLQHYQDALFNATSRQQQALFILNPKIGIVPAVEVEILAPIESNGIVVAAPPITHEVSFLPKQRLYLVMSYLAQHKALSASVQNNVIDELAKDYYQGSNTSAWSKKQQEEYIKIAKTFVTNTLTKIRDNYGKIQQAISATLQAQNAAEEQAAGSAIDLWTEFKTQFNNAQDSGWMNWLKYKFSGKKNARFEQLFIGSDLPVVKQYVEGALEVIVTDLVPYSAIMRIGENANEVSTEFAKIYTSDNGQRLLNFMIFGSALISAISSATSDDENSLFNRLDASYVAMMLKMGEDASSAELVKLFGQLTWYSVTGKRLTMGSNAPEKLARVAQEAQDAALNMTNAAEEVYKELLPITHLVAGALMGIKTSKVYGLNFNQSLENFVKDVQNINPNPSLDRIASMIKQDPRAAQALQGALFDIMSTASYIDKAGWLGDKILSSFRRAEKIASKDNLSSSDQKELKSLAKAITSSWSNTMEKVTEQTSERVKTGVINPQQAKDDLFNNHIAVMNSALESWIQGMTKIQAEYTQDFTKLVWEQSGSIQRKAVESIGTITDEVASLASQDKQEILDQLDREIQEEAVLNTVKTAAKAQIANLPELFKRLSIGETVTAEDVDNILESLNPVSNDGMVNSTSKKWLQGFLQGVQLQRASVNG